jgi:hypothetical protein
MRVKMSAAASSAFLLKEHESAEHETPVKKEPRRADPAQFCFAVST